MKDSPNLENEEYRKRTGDTTSQFASKDDSRTVANGGNCGYRNKTGDFSRHSMHGKGAKNGREKKAR